MSQYDAIVRELAQAPSLEAIRKIVDAHPAVASREGGALYSGNVEADHPGLTAQLNALSAQRALSINTARKWRRTRS